MGNKLVELVCIGQGGKRIGKKKRFIKETKAVFGAIVWL